MNISTPFPSHLPISPHNPATESARRDAQAKELVEQVIQPEESAAEKGVGTDTDKQRPASQVQETYDFSRTANETPDAIKEKGEREGEPDKERDESKGQQLAEQLSEAEQEQVEELKSRDAEVRTHEQAHANVGGQYAGAPSYDFETGPDGKRYAVGGEVSIDVSEVPGDPQATIQKMEQVKAAALAPAEPSVQDQKVAAEATQKASQARVELASGEGAEETLLSRASETQTQFERDKEIDAVAGRIQNFYSRAVEPRETGFTSFA